MIIHLTALLTAYLLGSLSSAILLSKLLHFPDPREHGSGNPGATNVLRVADRKTALYVLGLDMLKGFLPVLIARLIGLPPLWIGMVGVAAVVGHTFPVFFKFKGGKGVATTFGVMLALSWSTALLAAATWLLIAAMFRYASLASVIAVALAPLYALFFAPGTVIPLIPVAALIIWRHHGNIKRIKNRTESRIGE